MAYQFEDIKDTVVIVTGSGRGIGKGIAELFADYGANIVISDIDEDVCKATAEEIKKRGVDAIGVVCDVTKQDQVVNLADKAIEKWGKIDTLVNNAGITKDGLFLRMKKEQWQMVLDINF